MQTSNMHQRLFNFLGITVLFLITGKDEIIKHQYPCTQATRDRPELPSTARPVLNLALPVLHAELIHRAPTAEHNRLRRVPHDPTVDPRLRNRVPRALAAKLRMCSQDLLAFALNECATEQASMVTVIVMQKILAMTIL